MSYPLTDERIKEAKTACREDGSNIDFLDSINSVKELDALRPLMGDVEISGGGLINWYRKNLKRWSDPKLPINFSNDFSLLSARLDTSQKIRIFLRGADFRRVDARVMGSVFENIIRRHELDGEAVVYYERYRGSEVCDALRIVYHTQIPATTLTRLALPDYKSAGVSSSKGLFIDWRNEEERRADRNM